MENINGKKGLEIIELLKEQGVNLNKQLENTINLLAFEIYNNGEEIGIEKGKKIGVNQACREFEMKISTLRSKNIIE